jgi:uncharacterized protein (DUF2141 family)
MAAEFDRTAGRDSLMISKHLSGLVLAVLVAVPAQAAELRLTIQGVRSDAGELLIGLYASPDGFACALANASKSGLVADKGRLVGLSIRANAGAQSTVFTQLPPGRYAAVVIHDENDDGRLDANELGVPTEGYGFSNDAQGFLGAPSFDAAAVTIGEADVRTAISLIYPRASSAADNADYDWFIGRSLGELARRQ